MAEAAGLQYRLRLPITSGTGTTGSPALIMMHGYGANEGDIYELLPYIDRQVLIAAVRAPGLYNDDERGSFKWYDMDLQTCEAAPGAPDPSVQLMLTFIEQLAASAGISLDPARLFVGGFSQGAVMALNLAYLRPELFAGVVAHSCPFSDELDRRLRAANLRGKPFFLAHGQQDFLSIDRHGRAAARTLREIGADLTYHEYDFGHETSVKSRQDLADWLKPKIQ